MYIREGVHTLVEVVLIYLYIFVCMLRETVGERIERTYVYVMYISVTYIYIRRDM